MSNSKITALTSYTNPDATQDVLPIVDVGNGMTKKITRDSLLGITSAPTGISDSQTLSNKTLTNPTINAATLSGTIAGTYTLGGTPTFPATVVTTTASQTLTNKVLTSPVVNTATIANPTLTVDSIAEYTGANGVTIDGLSIKDSALNTANSVPNSAHNNTGAWGSSWAWTSWTPTWTNVTIGNAVVTAKYIQIGKKMTCRLNVVLGGTSSTAGDIVFTLPATSVALPGTGAVHALGTARMFDTSAGVVYPADIGWLTTTTACIRFYNAAGTYAVQGLNTGAAPTTWATSDEWTATFMYEVA